MDNTATMPATKNGFSVKIQNLELEGSKPYTGWLPAFSKLLIRSAAYVIMFSMAGLGYMLLPSIVARYRYGCEYKTITDKSEYKTDRYSHTFYTYDDGYQAWDDSDYPIGELVCIKTTP